MAVTPRLRCLVRAGRLGLLALLLATTPLTACSVIRESKATIARTREQLFLPLGFRAFFVDYDREGLMALVHNDCEITAQPPPFALNEIVDGDPTTDDMLRQRRYEYYLSALIEQVNARCVDVLDPDRPEDMARAKQIAREFRRIEVNGSLASFELATTQVFQKLTRMYGIARHPTAGCPDGPEQVVKHALLVYLPQGPRAERIAADDYAAYYNWQPGEPPPEPDPDSRVRLRDQMWDEVNDLLCGCYPNSHDRFQLVLAEILAAVTMGEREQEETASFQTTPVCLSSKSYSAHQVLRTVRDNERVLFYNIGPAFGLFDRAGVAADAADLPDNCADGAPRLDHPELCTARSSLPLNPLALVYAVDLQTGAVPQCLITSYQDCASLYTYGGALTSDTDYDFAPWGQGFGHGGADVLACPSGVPTRLRPLIDDKEARRSCEPLMGLEILADYLPTHDSSFVCSESPPPCVRRGVYFECPAGVEYCRTVHDACRRGRYETTSVVDTCYESGVRTHAVAGRCYRYGNADVNQAIHRNLAGGPGSIRLLEAARSDHQPVNCFGRSSVPDEVFCQAEHTEYWEAGERGVEAKMLDEIYRCTEAFATGCPACASCREVMDPCVSEVLPDGDIDIEYPLRESCDYQPCVAAAERVERHDVIYLPRVDYPDDATAQDDWNRFLRVFTIAGSEDQFRLSYRRQVAPLTVKMVPANDRMRNDRTYKIELQEEDVAGSDLVSYGFIPTLPWPLPAQWYEESINATHFGAWPVHSLLAPGGRYYGLAGAWLRLEAEGEYRVYDDETGVDSGESDELSTRTTAWDRQLLVMRWVDGDEDGAPDGPVPNITALRVGYGAGVFSRITSLPLDVWTFLPGSEAVERDPRLEIEVQPAAGGDPLVTLEERPVLSNRLITGAAYHSRLSWNVKETWCMLFDDAFACEVRDRTKPAAPERYDVRLHVKAYNDGNHFFRDYDVTIVRQQPR